MVYTTNLSIIIKISSIPYLNLKVNKSSLVFLLKLLSSESFSRTANRLPAEVNASLDSR